MGHLLTCSFCDISLRDDGAQTLRFATCPDVGGNNAKTYASDSIGSGRGSWGISISICCAYYSYYVMLGDFLLLG